MQLSGTDLAARVSLRTEQDPVKIEDLPAVADPAPLTGACPGGFTFDRSPSTEKNCLYFSLSRFSAESMVRQSRYVPLQFVTVDQTVANDAAVRCVLVLWSLRETESSRAAFV